MAHACACLGKYSRRRIRFGGRKVSAKITGPTLATDRGLKGGLLSVPDFLVKFRGALGCWRFVLLASIGSLF